MKPFTVVTLYSQGLFFEKTLLFLTKSDLVERVVILSQEPVHLKIPRCRVLVSGPLPSYKTLSLILAGIRTKYLLLLPGIQQISIEPKALGKILRVAESIKAGLVYSDFYDEDGPLHPRLRTREPFESNEKIVGQYSYPEKDCIGIGLPARHPLHPKPNLHLFVKVLGLSPLIVPIKNSLRILLLL